MATTLDVFVEKEVSKILEAGEQIVSKAVWYEGFKPRFAVATDRRLVIIQTKRAWWCKGLWGFIATIVRGAPVPAAKNLGTSSYPLDELSDVQQTRSVQKDTDKKLGTEWKFTARGVHKRFHQYPKDPSLTGADAFTLNLLPSG